MNRTAVSSSNLAEVGYEDGTLEIQFKSGAVYRYFDVPREIFEALLSAESHGAYFEQYVRGYYRYERV